MMNKTLMIAAASLAMLSAPAFAQKHQLTPSAARAL
jgi:predicted outer membrane protein